MTYSETILILDDEMEFLRSASLALRIAGYRNIETCQTEKAAFDALQTKPVGLMLLDIMMPEISGRDLLPRIASEYPGLPIIMSTAVNEIDVAVECMRAGAFDYLVKPIDKARLLTTVSKALAFSELKQENQRLSDSFVKNGPAHPDVFVNIITQNPGMFSMFKYIEAIAPTSMPVLILGETGSGKELVAAALHAAAGRTGQFVAVNSAGLDDTLFSDTLFGHERGAFSGADRKRDGLIVKAAGGTLFLDEIGDMKMETQVKLLRLIEDRTYYAVGSDTLCRTNARIVVATNENLTDAVAKGTFRKDLFYRLNSHTVRVPPLRNRKEDIPLLVAHFLKTAASEMGKPIPTPPPQLVQLLKSHSFPGNIRELRGMVYDAVGQHEGGVLSMNVFKQHLGMAEINPEPSVADTPTTDVDGFHFGNQLPSFKEMEAALVSEAMKRCGNNQSQAARLLGVTPSALNKRLNKS